MEQEDLIASDIFEAATLPARFYRDAKYFEAAKEKVFATSWQFAGDTAANGGPIKATPINLLEDYLDEPLILSRADGNQLHCLSNVCSHRGNLLLDAPTSSESIRCAYHGRRFGLDGCLQSAPGFESARNFPSAGENLVRAQIEKLGDLIFVSLNPEFSFQSLVGTLPERLSWFPFQSLKLDASKSKDYLVKANWALYMENYLEGLHVPYVHPALATTLDINDYRYELEEFSNLQLGLASNPSDAFDLPPSSPDYGHHIAAYYYWLFPNTTLNFYPWGLSINVVMPVGVEQTRVRYYTYVHDESRLGSQSPGAIAQTELEDQHIVQQVQKGMKSRLYERGRYSPSWEPNVHHFHRLLAARLGE